MTNYEYYSEMWREIENYPGYLVSNKGNILNEARKRKVKPYVDKNGYYKVNLCQHGRWKKVSVRRLVALAFLPGYFEGAFVTDHNGNKRDNRVENLIWSEKQRTTNNGAPRVSDRRMSVEEWHETEKYKKALAHQEKLKRLGIKPR